MKKLFIGNKTKLFGFLSVFTSLALTLIMANGSAFATHEETTDLFTGEGDVRWQYLRIQDTENEEEPESVSIMFYDKPAATTTIVVPSLADVIAASGASADLNTYYVKNADLDSQVAFDATNPKRESTADVTVLDMSNTSKVQIMGVKPIINPETEVELIFGENMVIGDGIEVAKSVEFTICTQWRYIYASWTTPWYICDATAPVEENHMERFVPNWDKMLVNDKVNYDVRPLIEGSLGYTSYSTSSIKEDVYDSSKTYFSSSSASQTTTVEENGVFGGYKLKLTNFNTASFNYIGWRTFKNSVFNEENTTITIEGDTLLGEDIFANTNIKKVFMNTNTSGTGLFRNCNELTEIVFGDNVNVVNIANFEGTNLGSFDFSQTNIKTLLGQAFKNAHLTSINLDGVNSLGYESFADNDLTELYLPKSITDFNSARTFVGNHNLTKLTVAYDTMLMSVPLHAAFGEYKDDPYSMAHTVTDLTVVAPYGADEEVNPNRLSYGQLLGRLGSSYGWNWSDDLNFAHADNYKNIVAPGYFYAFSLVKNLTIGEGYEFIGGNAFYQYSTSISAASYYGMCTPEYGLTYLLGCADRSATALTNLSLPESLKGIGTNAFALHYNYDFRFNLPVGLEYIGNFAFANDAFNTMDFDLPNLRYLGTHAFWINGFRNITLHDSLEHVGYAPFMGSWNLHDLTIDYDVFRIGHLLTGGGEGVSNMGHFNVALTEHGNSTWDICGLGRVMDWYNTEETTHMAMGWGMCVKKVGTVTFTEKAVTEPVFYDEGSNRLGSVPSSAGWFYQFAAEKVDLSKTPWKRITAGAFVGSAIDTLLLPEKLEFIGGMAFVCSRIMNELTIPDTVKVINYDAFNAVYYWYDDGAYFSGTIANPVYYDQYGNVLEEQPTEYAYMKPVKITKLPASLEYVGYAAFIGDNLLTADLNSPNLKVLGYDAFSATRLRDVTLGPKMKKMFYGALGIIPSLRDLTFDCDFFKIVSTSASYSYEYNWPFYDGGKQAFKTFYTYVNQIEGSYYCADHCIQWTHQQEYGKSFGTITFTNRNVTPMPEDGIFDGMVAENLDMGEAGWTTYPYAFLANAIIKNKLTVTKDMTRIPDGAFLMMRAKEVELPEILTEIGENSFMFADVEENLKLPDTVRRIGRGAFGMRYSDSEDCEDNIFYCVTGIEKLPSSLKYVGDEAFFGNYKLEGDLDIPSLLNIGHAAFMRTSLRDVVLHENTQYIGQAAFLFIPTIRNITLDCDFFEINDGYNKQFYSVFSSVTRDKSYQSQSDDASTFGDVVFTEKNIAMPPATAFGFFTANKIDIEKTKWTSIPYALFFKTNITEPVVIPETVTLIDEHAFQESQLTIANALPEGITTIGHAAFFAADNTDDLVIPSTVTSVGTSAFNAGPADVHYSTVTIKPADFSYSKTSGQAIFQMFWNNSIDKLVIDSEILPVMTTLAKDGDKYVSNSGTLVCADYHDTFDYDTNTCHNADNEETPIKHMPEFHAMNMKEVVLNNAGAIMPNAFEENANLEKVDLSNNSNLQFIGRNAFAYDDKLKTVVFGEGLAGKDVALGSYAFRGTAIESIGGADSDFNLSAANFNTIITDLVTNPDDSQSVVSSVDSYVFAEMPKLNYVYVPSTFSIQSDNANEELHLNGSYIPAYTFANDPELATVELDYQLSQIDEGTFLNDNKLTKLFVWGNANINENDTELTVPQVTNIFAYSDAPAEDYANAESRDNYEGKFYALDEVLYLTANKNVVILSDDKTDFDKEGLKLYGLRRDGVVLESDWKTYNTAFTRTSKPDQNFEEGRGSLGDDTIDMAALVFDAPKPFEVISLANKNFENVSYEFLPMPSGNDPLVAVHYPDGYTGNIRSTTLIAKTKEKIIEEVIEEIVDPTPEPQPEPQPDPTPEPQPQPTPAPKPQAEPEEEEELVVPDTGAFGALAGAATSSLSIATVIVLGGIFIAKKRKN